MSASTAYTDLHIRHGAVAILFLVSLLSSCSVKQVTVTGNFPDPVVEELPVTMGVIYPPEFTSHELYEKAQVKGESDWRFSTGEAQVSFWDKFLSGIFENLIHIRDWETLQNNVHSLDGILVPRILDLQYTVPEHTAKNVYEIQFFYEFTLVDPSKIYLSEKDELAFHPEESIASWTLVSYGKTPSAFIQSQEQAVNLAAVVSLRDAGANFAQNFGATPRVGEWLELVLDLKQEGTLNSE